MGLFGLFKSDQKSEECEICGTKKAELDKARRKEQAEIARAQASGGFFFGGITPDRSFLKCKACGKVICSRCKGDLRRCPYCKVFFGEDSYIYKSTSVFSI
jgi:hypothetical protein